MKEVSDVKSIGEVPRVETAKSDIRIKPDKDIPSWKADDIFDKICEENFEKTEIPVIEHPERISNAKRIENPHNMSLEEADGAFDKLCHSVEAGDDVSEDIKSEETNGENAESEEKETGDPENAESQNTFSDLDTMKKELDKSYGEIKDDKPQNSPDLAKWFENGGSVRVEVVDGKTVWTYIDKDGREVKYVDGYPVFPPEAKHPVIGDIDIGGFTGDRNEDKKLYLKALEEQYGLTEIPEGYVLHHDSQNGRMQLVREDWHKEFTHAGGHSKYKED